MASWMTGAKINRGLLLSVIMVQIGVYFFAQYVEYTMVRAALPGQIQISFWEYFDVMTRSFCWEENGQQGEPFGAWGYGLRVLEITGFALGGLIAPAILFALPYCDKCQVYMRTKELGLLPAGVPPRKIKKKDTAAQQAYAQESQEAFQRGRKLAEELLAMLSAGNAEAFARVLDEHAGRKKEIGKLTSRLAVKLQHCRRCGSGNVIVQLVSGQGQNVSTSEMGKRQAGWEFVRDVRLYSRQG